MRWGGGLGVLLAIALAAAGGGFALARATGPGEQRAALAAPVPAEPVLPVDPITPPAQDIDYPTLLPGLTYDRQRLGGGAFIWDYEAPRGWERSGKEEGLAANEYRWRPPDEPAVGGFSVRVKLVNTHQTPEQMLLAKLAQLEDSPDAARSWPDLTVLARTDDTLSFTYRVPSSNTLRHNTFRWITPSGSDEVGVEMSVAGRERDQAGLADLLDRVASSFRLR